MLVGVKAWQVPDAAQALRPLVGRDTFVVPLQNGVEAASQLSTVLGAGQTTDVVSNKFEDVYDGVDVIATMRVTGGGQVTAGINTGRERTNVCSALNMPNIGVGILANGALGTTSGSNSLAI